MTLTVFSSDDRLRYAIVMTDQTYQAYCRLGCHTTVQRERQHKLCILSGIRRAQRHLQSRLPLRTVNIFGAKTADANPHLSFISIQECRVRVRNAS